MKPSLCTALLLAFFVVLCGGQRSRDRPSRPHQQQQQKHHSVPEQSDNDDPELTDECPEPNGFFADGYQCDKYYECKDGAITEKLCPDGMVFNDFSILHEKCDLPFNLDCSQRPSLQDPKPSVHCPRQNGYFAHEDPKICDKFYFCVDGKFNMITCPSGLVYNEKTGICTWPDEAKKKHCSSEATEGNRIKRVAFWKSDEQASNEDSNDDEDNDDISSYDDSSEKGRKRGRRGSGSDNSYEYGGNSVESGEYPEYDDASGSSENGSDYSNDDYDAGGVSDDPEFSNFDAEFEDFVNSEGNMGYPGFTPHDFLRRKKDVFRKKDTFPESSFEDEDLDGYVQDYVKTIGKDPEKAQMGMDTKYYEQIAEQVVENEMEEEKQSDEERQKEQSVNEITTRSTPNRQPKSKNPHARLKKRKPTIVSSSTGRHPHSYQTTPASLTLKKPLNGVKWTYIPHPVRELQPPPVTVSWDPPSASEILRPAGVFRSGPRTQSAAGPLPSTTECYIFGISEVFKFECPKVDEKRAQQHPRYPDPEDCQFFYVCINGEVPRRNGCKIGQVFNEATGSCDWPRNVPECKEWYKGVLTDEELDALEHPKPKVRNSNYTNAAAKRKRPHASVQYDLPN